VLYRGELPRADAAGVVGTGDRQARRIVSALIEKGVLVSDSARAPLRLVFPGNAGLALDAGIVSREDQSWLSNVISDFRRWSLESCELRQPSCTVSPHSLEVLFAKFSKRVLDFIVCQCVDLSLIDEA